MNEPPRNVNEAMRGGELLIYNEMNKISFKK